MPTNATSAARLLVAALAVATLLLCGVVPARAEPDADNPAVGGAALNKPGLVINGQATPLPPGNVKSFVVADLDSGEIIAASNAHQQLPPASTLKMLTALTVLPRVDLDTVYTAVDDDVAVDGSKVGIVPGSTYTARQLFEGLFLISGNDAANALANLNGGVETTLEQMEAEAARVHAYDTAPRTPSGLDSEGQVSTAYDLALIARAGMARKDFAKFAGTVNSTFPVAGTDDPTKRPTFEIWTQNDLVNGGYEGAIGVKSGFTTQAGRTFAAAAERDGKRFLVTLMGIEGSTYKTGAAYLDWAFANVKALRPVGSLPEPKYGIAQSDAAQLVTSDGQPAMPEDAPAAQGTRDDVPAAQVAATGPAEPAAEAAEAATVAAAGGFRAGPTVILVGLTLGSCLLLWFGLRRQQRKAFRMRQPAPKRTPASSQPQKVSV